MNRIHRRTLRWQDMDIRQRKDKSPIASRRDSGTRNTQCRNRWRNLFSGSKERSSLDLMSTQNHSLRFKETIFQPIASSWLLEILVAGRRFRRRLLPLAVCGLVLPIFSGWAAPALGPLRIHPKNPRYFTDGTTNADGSLRAVYLTGAHTWNNLQDMGPTDPPSRFDFSAYLDFLEQRHHNFIRLWRWELLTWNTAANREKESQIHFATPHPWPRNGPSAALDGKPKFDLDKFDEAYWHRLRQRVMAAGERGIYVSIMLFEGWGLQFVPESWKDHPFHPANNINGIGGEVSAGENELEIYELKWPAITRLQENYVRHVVDTVNDLDNVLYEISNENHPASTEWQTHFIRFVHDYEKTKPKQHPVGMTFQYRGGKNQVLLDSPADWISPNSDAVGRFNYRDNPPPADGRKVILSDTDHLWGIGGNRAWAWKSFLRGLNPLFMDPYQREILSRGSDDQWEPVRRAMGDTRRLADRMNLGAMTPQPDLASTGYCLAWPGQEYLIYQPKGREAFTVQLAPGAYQYDWFNAAKGETSGSGRIETSGEKRELKAPFDGDAVLYLRTP